MCSFWKFTPRIFYDFSFIDLLYGLQCGSYNQGDATKMIERIFLTKNWKFTNSGRYGLYSILKYLNLKKGSNIGVQLYTCPVVLDAIIRAGHKPFFLDVNYNNYTLDIEDLLEKNHHLDAIIPIHTFGHPADIDEIRKTNSNIPIIEDCAHSIFSKYKKKMTGTLGDASFFSFGFGKNISAGGGGLIIFNKKSRFSRTINFETTANNSRIKNFNYLFKTYLISLMNQKPFYGLLSHPLKNFFDVELDIINKKKFLTNPMVDSQKVIILKSLKLYKEKLIHQRRNALFLIKYLNDNNIEFLKENRWAYNNYYLFPVRLSSISEKTTIQKALYKSGIDSFSIYHDTLKYALRFNNYKTGTCPNTENIITKTIILPHYSSLSLKDLKKIINIFTKVFK